MNARFRRGIIAFGSADRRGQIEIFNRFRDTVHPGSKYNSTGNCEAATADWNGFRRNKKFFLMPEKQLCRVIRCVNWVILFGHLLENFRYFWWLFICLFLNTSNLCIRGYVTYVHISVHETYVYTHGVYRITSILIDDHSIDTEFRWFYFIVTFSNSMVLIEWNCQWQYVYVHTR